MPVVWACLLWRFGKRTWNWRYGVYNQRLMQDEGNYTNDHLQPELAGRLANTIWYDEISDGRGYAHWAVIRHPRRPGR